MKREKFVSIGLLFVRAFILITESRVIIHSRSRKALDFSKINERRNKRHQMSEESARRSPNIHTGFNAYPVALLNFSDMGPEVGYYDFNEYNSLITAEDKDLESFLQNLAMILLVSLGGATYYRKTAIFDIPSGGIPDYRILAIAVNRSQQGFMEDQQVMVMFLPEAIFSKIPTISAMELPIISLVNHTVNRDGGLSSENLKEIRRGILRIFARNFRF